MSEKTAPKPNPTLARRLGFLSVFISIACLVIIAYIWFDIYNAPPQLYPGEIQISDAAQLQTFLAANVPPTTGGSAPMFVPTGIFIESVEFKGPYTLQMSGYVWQRYADSLPQDIDRGIVLPEAETSTFTKVYETHQDNETLVGWNFKATLRQQFDYSHYPLDRQQIWVQMWHVDFERDVYLTPDIAGYPTLAAETLPGVDQDFVIEHWQVEQSFFSYRLNNYSANFGIQGYDPQQQIPELYYNLSIKRGILSPLISRLIVPVVILLQLFVIVLVIGTDNKRLEQFGVRPGAVIFTCAAFFFAVLVAQNSLRDEVKAYGLVYLESVHLLTYLVILGVAVNSVLLVAQPDLKLFRDNDNMWVEVSYWPVILFIFMIITLLSFGIMGITLNLL